MAFDGPDIFSGCVGARHGVSSWTGGGVRVTATGDDVVIFTYVEISISYFICGMWNLVYAVHHFSSFFHPDVFCVPCRVNYYQTGNEQILCAVCILFGQPSCLTYSLLGMFWHHVYILNRWRVVSWHHMHVPCSLCRQSQSSQLLYTFMLRSHGLITREGCMTMKCKTMQTVVALTTLLMWTMPCKYFKDMIILIAELVIVPISVAELILEPVDRATKFRCGFLHHAYDNSKKQKQDLQSVFQVGCGILYNISKQCNRCLLWVYFECNKTQSPPSILDYSKQVC